jgi:hypothetical protein
MSMFLAFLEISDKVIPVGMLYGINIGTGAIGFLIGWIRWWASLLWLIGPTFFLTLMFGSLQYEEINYLYDHMVRELGQSYITHNMLAPPLGTILNLAGVFFWYFRKDRRSI